MGVKNIQNVMLLSDLKEYFSKNSIKTSNPENRFYKKKCLDTQKDSFWVKFSQCIFLKYLFRSEIRKKFSEFFTHILTYLEKKKIVAH
jgi:hypothetical protein